MKLQHYIGGLEGLREPLTLDRRVFAAEWEKRIFGIHVAMMGLSNHLGSSLPGYPMPDVPTTFHDVWTWADLRSSAEAMNPIDYFKFRYYERWLSGITTFLVEKGYLSDREIRSRMTDLYSQAVRPAEHQAESAKTAADIDERVIAYLRTGDSPRRDIAHPKFAVGQRVRIADPRTDAHTRLPGYLRGRSGIVTHIHEDNYSYFWHTGDGIGDPMPVYTVEFAPSELWGQRAEPGAQTFYAELFEAYLEEHA